jgi:hypothetical protein
MPINHQSIVSTPAQYISQFITVAYYLPGLFSTFLLHIQYMLKVQLLKVYLINTYCPIVTDKEGRLLVKSM